MITFVCMQNTPKELINAMAEDGFVNEGVVLKYTMGTGPTRIQARERLTMSRDLMTAIGYPLNLTSVPTMTEGNLYKFVFVTAVSSNHFHEAMDAIGIVQQRFPSHKLFYYDLDTDINQSRVNKV